MLGFAVGTVIGGGVGYAFKVVRAAPELGAARATTALPQSVKAEEAIAERSIAGERTAGITPRMAADGGVQEGIQSEVQTAGVANRPLSTLPEKYLKTFEGGKAERAVLSERSLLVRYGRPGGEYYTNFISMDAEYVADKVALPIERVRIGGAIYEAPAGTEVWVGRVAANEFGRGGAVQ